jgi:LysR family pca operon transcriptional activator
MTMDRLIDPRIKMRHLSCFIETARRRSVVKAAEALHMTQPAASKTIKELETILGVSLFERGRRPLSVSAMGEIFQLHAERAIAAIHHGTQVIGDTRSYPLVRIGALPTASARILPRAIAALNAQGRTIRAQISTGPNVQLLASLRRGEFDLILGRMAEPHDIAGLAFEHLYSEPLAAVVRGDHPLLAGGSIELRSISDYELIMPPPDAAIRSTVERLLAAHGIAIPALALETVSDAFARNYLRDTDAVWFISQGVVERDVADGHLVQLPVDLRETLGPVGLTTRIDQPLNAGASLLVETIRLLTARTAPGRA